MHLYSDSECFKHSSGQIILSSFMVTAVVNEMKVLHEEHSRRENVCTHVSFCFAFIFEVVV